MSGIQTDFAGDRDQFGGDIAITSTVPRVHPKSGQPLSATRQSVSGEIGFRTFMKGDIIFKDDPSKEFNFFVWSDDGGEESRRNYITLTLTKGFVACKSEDWIIRPELAMVWSVENGQIVSVTSTNPMRPSRDVLMYRSKERWEQAQKDVQVSNDISGESERKVGEAITDKRVQALPTKVEIQPHRFDPDAVG